MASSMQKITVKILLKTSRTSISVWDIGYRSSDKVMVFITMIAVINMVNSLILLKVLLSLDCQEHQALNLLLPLMIERCLFIVGQLALWRVVWVRVVVRRRDIIVSDLNVSDSWWRLLVELSLRVLLLWILIQRIVFGQVLLVFWWF